MTEFMMIEEEEETPHRIFREKEKPAGHWQNRRATC